MVIALPFIGIDGDPGLGEGVDMSFQGLLIGVMDQPQPDLTALAANRAHDWRTIIVISAVTALFIGPSAGRIIRVRVIITFFPPHSETFRRFQLVHRLRGLGVGDVGRWLEFLGELHAPWAD